MKVKEVIKICENNGWHLARTKGSHRQYKHRERPYLITIAGKESKTLNPGILNQISKKLGKTNNIFQF